MGFVNQSIQLTVTLYGQDLLKTILQEQESRHINLTYASAYQDVCAFSVQRWLGNRAVQIAKLKDTCLYAP